MSSMTVADGSLVQKVGACASTFGERHNQFEIGLCQLDRVGPRVLHVGWLAGVAKTSEILSLILVVIVFVNQNAGTKILIDKFVEGIRHIVGPNCAHHAELVTEDPQANFVGVVLAGEDDVVERDAIGFNLVDAFFAGKFELCRHRMEEHTQ